MIGSRVLREISLEVSELSFSAVVDTVLVVLRIELESRVAMRSNKSFNFVGVSIEYCDE